MARIMEEADPAFVEFWLQPVEDRNASIKAGHYVAKDAEYIRIIPPGGSLKWEGKVTDEHKQRYPRQYEAWTKGLEAPVDGTAISEWPPASPAQVRTLQALHIRTLEQFATCPDQAIQRAGMGYMALREKARKYLDAAKNQGQVVEENAALRIELEQQKQRMADLEAAIERLRAEEPPAKRGPGRPRKDAAA